MCARSASTGLCGGQRVTAVPTATNIVHLNAGWRNNEVSVGEVERIAI